MEITGSARKHGVADEDILHAWRNQLRFVLVTFDDVLQYLAIGPTRNGALIELIVPTDEPRRIIHAMPLRPRFHEYLT